jgi:hypothetical protein
VIPDFDAVTGNVPAGEQLATWQGCGRATQKAAFSASYSSPMSGPTHRARCPGIFSN